MQLIPTNESKTSATNFPLPTAHCPLPTAHCPLPTAHCPLPTANQFLNPTQLLGLAVTAISVLGLAVTWWRFPSRFWIACLLFFLLVHLEIWFGGRHQLHGLVSGWLKQLGWYSQRQTPQIAASLLLAVGLAVLGCWLLLPQERSNAAINNRNPTRKRGISGISSLTRRVTKQGQFVPASLVKNRRRPNRLGAILSIGLLALLFGLELVSLHAVDAVLYQKFGSVLLIGWLWAAACIPLWCSLIRHAATTVAPARQRNQK